MSESTVDFDAVWDGYADSRVVSRDRLATHLIEQADVIAAEEVASRSRTIVYGMHTLQDALARGTVDSLSVLVVEFDASRHAAELEQLCILAKNIKDNCGH